MLSFFNKLFGRNVKLEAGINTFMSALNSDNKEKMLFSGFITMVDFDRRRVEVLCNSKTKRQQYRRVIDFDKIVTISRMKDGRLRMWVSVED